MNTTEAIEILAKKYPDVEVAAWDWIKKKKGAKQQHNLSVDVDGRTFYGSNLEEAIAKVNLPLPEEKARQLRQMAAELISKADALSPESVQAEPAVAAAE